MKRYKQVLLLDSSEIELSRYKRQMDMFGLAGHIQTETCGVSAMYYLRNTIQLPDLVIANIEKGTSTIQFISELEQYLRTENKRTSILLIYEKEEKALKKLYRFKQMKKPMCLMELMDEQYWDETYLN